MQQALSQYNIVRIVETILESSSAVIPGIQMIKIQYD